MLNELSITNFAIIDALSISFEKGLNIISGETGAGKSILIGAVSLLLGERATADMIRTQAEAATVEALFNIQNNKILKDKLSQMGFEAGDELIVRRVISRSGKNRAQINGQMATLSHLAAVSESLINICGQHEHQIILNAESHIDILDEFGGCFGARADYRAAYDRYLHIRERMTALENIRRHRAEKTDLLEFQLKEIERVGPLAGEDTALSDEKKVLANAQKLSGWAERAYGLLYADTNCINDQLKEALTQIKEIIKIDPGLKIPLSEMDGSFALLNDAALTLRDYARQLVFDPERLAAIDERLDQLNRLKRKHGGTLEAVLAKKKNITEELETASGVEEELAKLDKEKENQLSEMRRKAKALSAMRRAAALRLKKAVEAQIRDLNMPHAVFSVEFLRRSPESEETFGPRGADDVEFYLSANPGEDPRPLNKIASGGELSRIVLGLKNVLSQTGSVATVVFDEVDSGIGGATAEIVGRKLQEVSANHQVICITHLPQIASFGGLHLRVTKSVANGRTATQVETLDEQQKVEEISRMLGGVHLTRTARDHAQAMLDAAATKTKHAGTTRSKHAEKSTHQ